MIELKNLSFSYENSSEAKGQLRGIDLHVKKGELVILSGRSGCGKTTLTRILNGLCPGRQRGTDDVIAYHLRQSFMPGEITPEKSNEIGRELALKLTKGNNAFIVCTHIDRHHVHNHIIINSVDLDCFVCNQQEAGILFVSDFSDMSPEELCDDLSRRVISAQIPSMVVTMGSRGAVYADMHGDKGVYPAQKVTVRDTTGAGDAFCAGVAIGLTYKKSMREAVEIGTRLAASVITASENVCPRFRPRELGLDVEVES